MSDEFTVDYNAGTVTHRSGLVFELVPGEGYFDLRARQDTLRLLPVEEIPNAQKIATRAMDAWLAAKSRAEGTGA